MRVLLHICCAPCSIYPLGILRGEGAEVTGFFFNPNIHPYTEFQRRITTLETYGQIAALSISIDASYDLEGFLRGALGQGKDRCLHCYRFRLEKVFRKGVESGVDAVTTTLLYSRYQRHDEIKAVGEELSALYGLPFLYRDFRVGWKKGIEESKRLGLYRQQYCGCIFSEKERFAQV